MMLHGLASLCPEYIDTMNVLSCPTQCSIKVECGDCLYPERTEVQASGVQIRQPRKSKSNPNPVRLLKSKSKSNPEASFGFKPDSNQIRIWICTPLVQAFTKMRVPLRCTRTKV